MIEKCLPPPGWSIFIGINNHQIERWSRVRLWGAELTQFWLKRSSEIERVDVKRSIAVLWREMIFIDIYSAKRRAFQFHRGKKVFTKTPLSLFLSLLVWSTFYQKLFSLEPSLPRTSCWMVWKCLSVVGKVRRDRRWFHSGVGAYTRARCTYAFILGNILSLVARRRN